MKHSKSVRVYGKPLKSERVESAETPSWVVEEPPVFLVVKVDKAKVAEAKTVEPATSPAPVPVAKVAEEKAVAPPPIAEKKVKTKRTKTVTPPAPKVVTPVPTEYRYTRELWADSPRKVDDRARNVYERFLGRVAITPIGKEVILLLLTGAEDFVGLLRRVGFCWGSCRERIEDTCRDFEFVTPQQWVDLLCNSRGYFKRCLPRRKSGRGHEKGRRLMSQLLKTDGFDVTC